MYYYKYSNGIVLSVSDVYDPNKQQMADSRNIPAEFCEILNGELYDTREVDYHRLKKIAELTAAAAALENGGYRFGDLTVSCTRAAISDYNDLLKLAELENDSKAPVEFLTPAGPVTLPLDRFRTMCKEVGRYYKQNFFSAGAKIKKAKDAKTVAEIEEIV